MPQLHLYIPDPVAAEVRRRAQAAGLSTSGYLAELIKREVASGWPVNFFENVVGGWQGEPLKREPQGDYNDRDILRPLGTG